MKHARVGVLMGGMSAEREISLKSGEAVYQALSERGYDVVKIFVDRDVDRVLRQQPIDVAFVALHGSYGEDGCIQGLLETLGIPYTGSGVLASALAMDKLKAKELFRLYNVPTPPYYMVRTDELERIESIHGSFGYPAFVKPRRSGSSVGAGIATSLRELTLRVEEALAFDNCVLVERFVRGREIFVPLLDGEALGAVEAVPQGDFFDYRSKYQSGQCDYHCPPKIPATRYQGILNIAERANHAVGATGISRVDMLVTEGENEYVLEVNTLPGLTRTSLVPQVAEKAGYSFEDLCELIVERAGCNAMGSLPVNEVTASGLEVADAAAMGGE